MHRILIYLVCIGMLSSFYSGDPILGKWGACGKVGIGDNRIELTKRVPIPCAAQGNTWSDLTFDTINSGRVNICTSSCGNIPPGVPCLAASGTCHYGKWSYDASSSTLMIKDSTTVYYLVSSITDSSMVLIKK